MVTKKNSRWLFLAGGICGILYPVLDIGFFALYPLAARGALVSGGGVEAGTEAEGAAIAATLHAMGAWHRGLNVIASILYQAFVGLSSVGLVLGRTYRVRGWIGIGGALFALLKFTALWPGMTNFLWTGVAYTVWPIAVGIRLLRESRRTEAPAD